jgi:DNA (cytosine-5)-methyltransferase 1
VLNAGNYGVPQSRKRTFIWAAAPEELLPSWPQQQYVFRSPQLTINLPGGVAYTAVPQREVGAPGTACPLTACRQGHLWACCCWCPGIAVHGRQPPALPDPHLSVSPQSAPLRTVTVRDAIGDLPPIQNGHDQ